MQNFRFPRRPSSTAPPIAGGASSSGAAPAGSQSQSTKDEVVTGASSPKGSTSQKVSGITSPPQGAAAFMKRRFSFSGATGLSFKKTTPDRSNRQQHLFGFDKANAIEANGLHLQQGKAGKASILRKTSESSGCSIEDKEADSVEFANWKKQEEARLVQEKAATKFAGIRGASLKEAAIKQKSSDEKMEERIPEKEDEDEEEEEDDDDSGDDEDHNIWGPQGGPTEACNQQILNTLNQNIAALSAQGNMNVRRQSYQPQSSRQPPTLGKLGGSSIQSKNVSSPAVSPPASNANVVNASRPSNANLNESSPSNATGPPMRPRRQSVPSILTGAARMMQNGLQTAKNVVQLPRRKMSSAKISAAFLETDKGKQNFKTSSCGTVTPRPGNAFIIGRGISAETLSSKASGGKDKNTEIHSANNAENANESDKYANVTFGLPESDFKATKKPGGKWPFTAPFNLGLIKSPTTGKNSAYRSGGINSGRTSANNSAHSSDSGIRRRTSDISWGSKGASERGNSLAIIRRKSDGSINIARLDSLASSQTHTFNRRRMDDDECSGSSVSAEDAKQVPVYPGTMEERYELSMKIGSGSYGDVFLAYKRAGVIGNDKFVDAAIKTIKDRDRQARIFDEIRIMSLLNTHAHIVEAYECFVEDGDTANSGSPKPVLTGFAVEYCGLGTLKDFASKCDLNRLCDYHIAKLLKGTAQGLLHIHFNHIMHLDLSLHNVMLTLDDVPKIGDFGCSRQFKPGKTYYRKRGTPLYMSAEMICGRGYTKQTDIWSLGILSLILIDLLYPLAKPLDPMTSNFIDIKKVQWQDQGPNHGILHLLNKFLQREPAKRVLTSSHFFLHTRAPSAKRVSCRELMHDEGKKSMNPIVNKLGGGIARKPSRVPDKIDEEEGFLLARAQTTPNILARKKSGESEIGKARTEAKKSAESGEKNAAKRVPIAEKPAQGDDDDDEEVDFATFLARRNVRNAAPTILQNQLTEVARKPSSPDLSRQSAKDKLSKQSSKSATASDAQVASEDDGSFLVGVKTCHKLIFSSEEDQQNRGRCNQQSDKNGAGSMGDMFNNANSADESKGGSDRNGALGIPHAHALPYQLSLIPEEGDQESEPSIVKRTTRSLDEIEFEGVSSALSRPSASKETLNSDSLKKKNPGTVASNQA